MNPEYSKTLLDLAQDVRKEHEEELKKGKLDMSSSEVESEASEETKEILSAPDPIPNDQLNS